MNRKRKTQLTHLLNSMKKDYHELSEVLCDDEFMASGIRGDKLRTVFTLQDLAVSELNEVLGKVRSD